MKRKTFNVEMKDLIQECESCGLELQREGMYVFTLFKDDKEVFSCNFLEQLWTFLDGYKLGIKGFSS